MGFPKLIMVVDDEHMVEQMIESHVAKSGYEHVSFHDPTAAMAFFQDNSANVGLAILDRTMPGLAGDEMAAQMCELAPNLPIILMTGHLDTSNVDSNVNTVITKPITRADLLKAIDQLIGPACEPENNL